MKDSNQALHSMAAVPLEALVKEEYRTYQIYTLMDRAIPYLQDGLKPSQRRILFTPLEEFQQRSCEGEFSNGVSINSSSARSCIS